MATKNRRINVVFEEATTGLPAQQEHKSISRLVQELSLEALETREDQYLSKVAEKLDQAGTKTYSHDDTWK